MRFFSGDGYSQACLGSWPAGLLRSLLIVAVLLLLPPPIAGGDGLNLEGRIFTRHGPLPDAVAALYTRYEDIPDSPIMLSEPADAFGIFRLAVPQGRYYFMAFGSQDNVEYRAFHGNNPVLIRDRRIRLGLMALPVKEAVRRPGTGLLKGVVTYKGTPVADGYVSVYPPTAGTFKGLGLKTDPLEPDGTFSMRLTPGRYVVTAKKTSNKGSESGFGPPRHGDLIGYFPVNPVEVTPDEDVFVEVPTYPRADRPAFDEVTRVEYWQTGFTSAFNLAQVASGGIKGRVVDVQGAPVADIYVLAYKTEEPVFQMFHLSHGTPNISWTDADGGFFIPLEESGNYYLVARSTLGNAPHRDEFYGLYQGHPMHRLSYEKGKLVDGIEITAGITMDKGEDYKTDPEAARRVVDHEIKDDLAIDRDTIWSGTITVNGVVSVKRGVTLTIEPGTTVRFRRLDRDGNRIGDGEILVEGRIVAMGKPGRKIVFTSAEGKPAVRDWSYVNILSTGADNLFSYCVFEYGFSGMQIHYSNARVYDCLFHNNGEGLHFNTVNLEAVHNTLENNGVGVKFSRLEGKVRLHNNLIRNNDIGIQFTHQHINAVDFENLHKYLEPPLFVANSIEKNRKYNFSMGELQSIDIDVSGNWWGSDEPAIIEEAVFDKDDDGELGRVRFMPPLSAPVFEAGVRKRASAAP